MSRLIRSAACALALVLLATACGNTSRLDSDPTRGLAYESSDTTTTSIVVADDPTGASADQPTGGSGRQPSSLCGLSGEIHIGRLTANRGPAVVVAAPSNLLASSEFESLLPDSEATAAQVIVCMNPHPTDGNVVHCGVVGSASERRILELEATVVGFTWYSDDVAEPPYQTGPLRFFEECPDIETSEPTKIGTDDVPIEVRSAVLSSESVGDALRFGALEFIELTSDTREPLTVGPCQALRTAHADGKVMLEDLARLTGSDTLLFSPRGSGLPTLAEAEAFEASQQVFGDANAVLLQNFEGQTLRQLPEEIHLLPIFWRRVGKAVVETGDQLSEDWLRWKMGRAANVGFGGANPDHVVDVMDRLVHARCADAPATSEAAPVYDAAETAEVCGMLQPMYEDRALFRAELLTASSSTSYWRTESIWRLHEDLDERFPGDSNPFFSITAVGSLLNAEYALHAEIDSGRPMDHGEITTWEADAVPLHQFTTANCDNIDDSLINLPSALDAAPTLSDADTAAVRAEFCTTLGSFFEQRSIFRSQLPAGAGPVEFDQISMAAFDEMRRLAPALIEQLEANGAAIEPDPDANISSYRIESLIAVEVGLRQFFFNEHPIPVDNFVVYEEEQSAHFTPWAVQHCDLPAALTTSPASVVSLPVRMAAPNFLTGFPSEAEVQAELCPRMDAALWARMSIHHQLATFDVSDPDRLSDIRLTSSRFNDATLTLGQPFRLTAGTDSAQALMDAFDWLPSTLLWAVIDNDPLDQADIDERLALEAEMLAIVADACPEFPAWLIQGEPDVVTMVEAARVRAHG
jgi:hypothetical protein